MVCEYGIECVMRAGLAFMVNSGWLGDMEG